MYKTKKEVDAHVRTALSKMRNESDRNLRGFAIAKLYYKVNDFVSTEQYLLTYLKTRDDNDQAYKLLGQCYQRLKKSDKALQAYQRSLQLNSKQPDVLVEVCQLLLDEPEFNDNKARYWCELAESEKVQHDAVFSLRLKMVNKGNMHANQVEELIYKEIAARPKDVQLRVRLLRSHLEQNRLLDAYAYVRKAHLNHEDVLAYSAEWHNIVWLVLSKYEQLPNIKRDFELWLLLISCLERQVAISFNLTASSGCTETANLLFQLDQYLFKMAQASDKFSGVQKEFVQVCLSHYRGQLLLHAAALMYKRELLQNKNMWKEVVKVSLPLLFLAYQVEPPENKEPWMKHCDEQNKNLLQLWYREGAFRCAQVGRTLLSCVADDLNTSVSKENTNKQLNSLLASGISTLQQLWNNCDEMLAQVRQTCADKQWRVHIFAMLFCNSDQRVKENVSLLAKSPLLAEPVYELPNYEDLERYEETAQLLQPQSLAHMIYLSLSNDNLAHVRAKYFSGLNFSTANLAFCGAESLNRLDIETFLYAAVLQAKRQLEVEHDILESYQSGNRSAVGKPRLLLFVNVQAQLCTDEQSAWWQAAFQVYKNLCGDNLAEMRTKLQHGIEAVRGINGTKIDMLIVFKLGKIFVQRAQDVVKPVEKAFLEARAANLYKHGLNMLKLHQKGVLEPYNKYFKYAKSNNSAVEREINKAAEDAVSYMAAQYFKKGEYEDFIEDFNGLQLPFATYMQAEAYRRLEEADNTPKKGRRVYLDRAFECLNQTLALLKSTQTDPDHPLNSVLQTEMKCLHHAFGKYMFNDGAASGSALTHGNGNNSSTYEDAEADSFAGELPSINTPARRVSRDARRESLGLSTSTRNSEVEQLIKQMMGTLTFVKEELTDNIKPEVLSMRKEIGSLKEKIANLEDSLKKSQESHAQTAAVTAADAASVLDDIYIIEDALQNQIFTPNTPVTNASNYAGSPFIPLHQQQQQQQQQQLLQQPGRIQTPNTLQMQQNAAAVAAAAAYGNSMFNPNYAAMAYYSQSPYMLATQGAAATQAMLGARNPLTGMSYGMPDALSGMNYNMNSAPSLLQPTGSQQHVAAASAGNNHLYGLLTQSGAHGISNQQFPPFSSMHPMLPPPTGASTATTSAVVQQPLLTTSTKATVAAIATTPTSTTAAAGVAGATFNKALNNKPVEKLPPANVVITNSDPLPKPNSTAVQAQQVPLSVTIPSHHIKSTANVPVVEAPTTTTAAQAPFGGFGGLSGFSTNAFSFKPQVAQALQQQQQQLISNADNNTEGHDKSSNSVADADAEVEYDAHPDFKPIIPLPAEIEVKTGEEDEEVKFCCRAKLFRFMEKEWKERGIGEIKILKHPDGHSRVLMRREQIHKICANHKIDGSLKLTTPNNETKGFVWAANDFADGTLQVEKFFIRFKLQESATAFKAAFEAAVKEAHKMEKSLPPVVTVSTAPPTNFVLSKSAAISNFATSTPAAKGEVAQVFAVKSTATVTPTTPTTPSLLANLNLNGNKVNAELLTANNNKNNNNNNEKGPSPFAGFTFGGGAATSGKPFASMFSNSNAMAAFQGQSKPSDINDVVSSTSNETVAGANRSNISENGDDDYVPTAQFKPVISLPDLVEINTGEENELVLFEYRAKLLRFDKSTSEWKERGLGNIKLLQQKQNVNEVRLLMRREQVHKLCCNQRIYKDTKFMLAKTAAQNAVTWAGQDYSENELVTETMTLRFKTADITKDFLAAVHKVQNAMSAEGVENNAKKSEESMTASSKKVEQAEKQEILPEQGFGAQFKPKAGSWNCETCYINNIGDDLYCVACHSPKDSNVPPKQPQIALNVNGGTAPVPTFSFGFKNNTTTTAAAVSPFSNNKQAFVFAKPSTNDAKNSTPTKPAANNKSETTTKTTATTTATATTADKGFGDKFKPKAGSWTCEVCYISNTADELNCVACQSPKHNTVPEKGSQGVILEVTSKFNFGFNATSTQNNNSTNTTTTTPLVFGQSKTPIAATTQTAALATTTTTSIITKDKGARGDVTKSFDFSGFNMGGSTPSAETTTTTTKPAFSFTMPTSSNDPTSSGSADNTITSPFALESSDFRFTMKSNKLNRSGGGGGDADVLEPAADDGEYNEEENNTYFTPVIPLPDKIEVKTGEEEEEVLFVHRAKLYRFIESEWKERGLGDVKILRHKETKKLRVVMRREQILKICLNHVLNADVEYKPKDEKSWLFVVNDFSEGSIELEQFTLRFKTKEIATSFMDAVQNALAGTAEAIETPAKNTASDLSNNNVLDINETDKALADKLKLPYSMYTSKPTCAGCRGCNDENFIFQWSANESFVHADDLDVNELLPLEFPALVPPKGSALNRSLLKQSTLTPNSSSLMATPSPNSNKTPTSSSTFSFMAAAKENQAPAAASFVFGGGNNTTSATSGGSLFGGNTNSTIKKAPVFGQKDSIFGASHTKSNESIENNEAAQAPPSIFGGTNSSASLFSGKPFFGGTIFGNSSAIDNKNNTPSNIFGSSFNAPSNSSGGVVGGGGGDGKPIFGTSFLSSINQTSFGGFNNLNKTDATAGFISHEKEAEKNEATTSATTATSAAATNAPANPPAFTFGGGGMDFASLAKSSDTQPAIKSFSMPPNKTGEPIKFVGLTNEDAFSSFQRKSTQNDEAANNNNNKLNNGNDSTQSVGAENEEHYDPYYAPAIALPKEIVVSTGEENETKMFGERAKLYRYDDTNKEWKERGVGELKILQHNEQKTYRLILRREQVQKLVLNHAISEGFTFTNLGNDPKSLVWATMNYAESADGVLEKLAVRFKKQEQTEEFRKKLNECIENSQKQQQPQQN